MHVQYAWIERGPAAGVKAQLLAAVGRREGALRLAKQTDLLQT